MIKVFDFNPDEVHIWYVVFHGESSPLMPLIARPFVSPGFRHCYAMRGISEHQALIVDNIAPGLLAHVADLPVEYCAVGAHDRGYNVVQIACSLQPRYTLRVMSCVSVIKALLGVHDRSIWTPRQLYRHLLKIGGQNLCEVLERNSRP